ncbi:hypothetical protein JOE45_003878 [Paenibacillus sp. PvR098]|nr:hypothetical protein [Paenibacillus sp. PvP091]MBP1171977.1 hypothetical protein [Paenibacillus sp. PvR098]MBP2438358.1 hypothetical protein [Paenibacillus sp. PvP052]
MVYIKPNRGTGGKGIVKAEMFQSGAKRIYRYKLDTSQRNFSSFDPFFHSLRRVFGKKTYLIQKGIRMLRYKGRPFDVRIMVQKNERGHWEHTGTIGRLAHPNRIVTNYHSGGTPLALRILLSPHLRGPQRKQLENRLSLMGMVVAKHMQSGFPRIKEIGLDVGMDRHKTPWIFEVNSQPDPFIFLKLNKPSVFRRIFKLTRLHGRFRRFPLVSKKRR